MSESQGHRGYLFGCGEIRVDGGVGRVRNAGGCENETDGEKEGEVGEGHPLG